MRSSVRVWSEIRGEGACFGLVWFGLERCKCRMCPLRVILLFLSAMLAGYFAIKTIRAQGESSVLELSEEEPEKAIEQTGLLAKVTRIRVAINL